MIGAVDVVIPCYNYARYLRGCVQSVLGQPDVAVRVLIIDDASSDETAQVGSALAEADTRVEFHRHVVNKGHIATYNEGLLEWSASDYVALLSADDLLAPGSLSRAVRVMNGDHSIGMVYGSTVHFAHEGQLPTVSKSSYDFNRWSGEEWLQGRCRAAVNVITSPEVVVRGTVQRKVGGYRPELPHAGDLEMWLRIAAVSNIAYIRRVPQAFYRVHPSSMMRTRFSGALIDLEQRYEVFFQFFQAHMSSVRRADSLFAEAKRSLAREALWMACRAYDRNDLNTAKPDELESFATAIYENVQSLSEYAALQRRRRLGVSICHRTQLFAAPALMRSMRRRALKQRWKRHGV